jgi:hypothetical protein
MLVFCLQHYYSVNMAGSKLLSSMTSSGWFPQEAKQSVSLSSVLRFELFDAVNPIYQLKFMGNMYLNLRALNIEAIEQNKHLIKENVLKAAVRYDLRVFLNIMVLEDWGTSLEKTKLDVSFEQLGKRPEQSLKTIMKSVSRHPETFIESMNELGGRINDLESLLGGSSITDKLILDILNSYYTSN